MNWAEKMSFNGESIFVFAELEVLVEASKIKIIL